MRMLLVVLALAAACGARTTPRQRVGAPTLPAPATPGPGATGSRNPAGSDASSPAAGEGRLAVGAAVKLVRALVACDKPAALAMFVSFDEAMAMSTKPTADERSRWNRQIADFIDRRCKELAPSAAKKISAKLVRIQHVERRDHPDLRHDVDVYFVQYQLDGHPQGPPRMFIRTDRGFRFLLHN